MQDRYLRNILIDGFGEDGQERLKAAKVLVVGAGGIGSPALFYLAAAGVSTIGIVDDDTVSMTNLQRQILHFTNDLGRRKTASASEKLIALNPDVKIVPYNCRFTKKNAEAIIGGAYSGADDGASDGTSDGMSDGTMDGAYCGADDGASNGAFCGAAGGRQEKINGLLKATTRNSSCNGYDFVIDGSDNYATKLLINDMCVKMKKPYSHGAVVSMRGEVMTYLPGTACYRCVFETPPTDDDLPTATQTGILGSVAGIVGSIQAAEAIKHIVGMGGLITNRILIADVQKMNFFSLKVEKRGSCICGV